MFASKKRQSYFRFYYSVEPAALTIRMCLVEIKIQVYFDFNTVVGSGRHAILCAEMDPVPLDVRKTSVKKRLVQIIFIHYTS